MLESSRTDIFVVESSRTDLYDDVVDVTSFSALDVVEIKKTFLSLSSSMSALDVAETKDCMFVFITSVLQCCFWTFGQP